MEIRRPVPSFEAPWGLPAELPWQRFLRLLRHPDPPRGWLEAAAALEDLRRRPLLLRWVAQHPKAPAHLRARLMGRLPWRALAAVAQDAAAHPQARAQSVERLLQGWPGLSLGERRSLAILAPPPLWRHAWRAPDAGVVLSLLQNPRLGLEALLGLVQAPFTPHQAEALPQSPWRESIILARQVLFAFDRTLQRPEPGLVLGQAAPWIRLLEADEAIEAAAALSHPALRRMVRNRAGGLQEFA
ncbi:MAG TPA: hypothetical protein VFT46_04225 [Holophagaceae bacterium]|nr:hypothetical protein [Holophagaceae bacterium]